MNTVQYHYNATVVRVVDGDTVDMTVALGFHVRTDIRTRLFGINAPEMKTPEGKVSKTYLQTLLLVGTRVTVSTYKDPNDKYGRWLANIETEAVKDISANMVTAGQAIYQKY